MATERIIGLDVGTTGTRAVVFDPEGRIYASATGEYPLLVPKPGYGEQDPEAILQAVVKALKEAVAKAGLAPGEVTAVGISAVMHSMIALGRDGTPLTKAWTWVDTRAVRTAERIKAQHDVAALYSRTGCPMHPMYLPAKIAYLRETAPDAFASAERFISIKEYLLWRLFGARLTDFGVASGSGLFHMEKMTWDDEALAIAGITKEQLSQPVEPTTIVRGLKQEYADEIGIAADTPFAIGSSDGTLSTLGVGAVQPGQMTAMIGTSGAVRAISERPTVDAQARTWCYYLAENRWVAGAAINNAGIVYRWVCDELLHLPLVDRDATYASLVQEAALVPPGSNGLVFLPFLAGERAPYWNADARGVLFGLSLGHSRAHIVRATLEGVAYRMYSIFDALREVTGQPREVRTTGGFTKSPLWVQILADVFGECLSIPEVHEASSFGAAFLAMLGLGLAKDIADIQKLVRIVHRYEPDEGRHQRHQYFFDLYMRLYWHLQDQFAEIASIQRGEDVAAVASQGIR